VIAALGCGAVYWYWWNVDVRVEPLGYWLAGVLAVVGGVATATFAAPALSIGPRLSAGYVVGRIVAWVASALGAGVIGVFVTRLVEQAG
jgi:hypothetical protein